MKPPGWYIYFMVLLHISIGFCQDVHAMYEYLITLPRTEQYRACIEENLIDCEVFINEDSIEKRSPNFNSWGGKRAQFSSWGGKRDSYLNDNEFLDDVDDVLQKRAKFSNWGGKRGESDANHYDDKRAKFSTWGGKRAQFNSWGGKRTQFNSWGGKRAKFSNWGGKRSDGGFYDENMANFKRTDQQYGGYKRKPSFSSWGGKRSGLLINENRLNDFLDSEKRTPKFSNWGGKRSYYDDDEDLEIGKRAKFSNWGGKRSLADLSELEKRAKFASWGGKRSSDDFSEIEKRAKFASWGGKRTTDDMSEKRAKFSNWGGKRNDDTKATNDEHDISDNGHTIKKRETSEHSTQKKREVETAYDDYISESVTDLWKEFFERISNPNFNKNNPINPIENAVVVVDTGTTMTIPVKKSARPDPNLHELFKQFVFWKQNRPEEKKNADIKSRIFRELNVGTPMRRGTVDFYAWGGKRSEVTTSEDSSKDH